MADGAAKSTRLTQREFLEWEESQPLKYELIGGFVRGMAGGTLGHNTIKLNIALALRTKLRGSKCRPYDSDTKVLVAEGQVFYPDITVDCGEMAANATYAQVPTVVLEVLSPSTRTSDFEEKLPAYQALPSVMQIVFVETRRMHLYVWTRGEDGWVENEVARPTTPLTLPTLGIELTLAEVYEDAPFGD